MKRLLITVLIATSLAKPAFAGFDEGLAAALRGDYAQALKEWKPLAEQGLPAAQYNLGRMYDYGYGVDQNYELAVEWYRKAAYQGYTYAQLNLV